MFQPELSVLPAGSSEESPVAKVAVAPPASEAVPEPTDGDVLPVLVLPSGGVLLKFHWEIIPEAPVLTVKIATLLVMLPAEFVTTTEYAPALVNWALVIVSEFVTAPAMSVFVLKYH